MANYEEMYYAARNKFNAAVETRNSARNKTRSLNSQRSAKKSETLALKTDLTKNNGKKILIERALCKCESIIATDGEFYDMKSGIMELSENYKTIIQSDLGMIDFCTIYEEDINATKKDLERVQQELQQKFNECTSCEENLNKKITSNEADITSLSANIKRAEDEAAYAQRQIDSYYVAMQEYKRKWENGE